MDQTLKKQETYNIREMRVEDAKDVALIHTQAWQSAYKGIVPQKFLDEIDLKKRQDNWAKGIENDPTLIRLVATNDYGKVLGFVCGLNNRDKNPNISGELWAIYVNPNSTSNGIGQTLFKGFVEKLVSRDIFSMNVWVLEENIQARQFYEKMGGTLSTHKKNIEIGGKELVEVSYEYILSTKNSSCHTSNITGIILE